MLVANWPIENARTVIERTRVATPQGHTCSAGLAAFDGSETAQQLTSRADAALYESQSGRPRPHGDRFSRPRSLTAIGTQ